jgi:hypothetical protein
MRGSYSDDVQGSARERYRSRRALQSLLNWAAMSDVDLSEADLATIPADARALVIEEAEEIRKMYRSGDRGGARNRAAEAAGLLVAAFGPGADQPRSDPRAEAARIRGEEAPATPTDEPKLLGGGDPHGDNTPMDPRALGRMIRGAQWQ